MKSLDAQIADYQPSPEVEEAYEEWQKGDYESAPKLRGLVADSERGFISWRESFSPGTPLGETAISPAPSSYRVNFAVTPHRKRTPKERLADVTKMLLDSVLPVYRATGQVVLPQSVLRQVQQIFWEQGTPVSVDEIQSFTEDQLRDCFTRYAAYTLAYCERAYPANAPSVRTDLATGHVS